jgi:hypothetical protein
MWRGSRHTWFSTLMICMSVHGAQIDRAPGTYALSIDRQPLDGALQQLAHQCGVQVIFFSRVTEGLSAPAIQGDYTLAAAMDRLLAGTGLTSRVINPQTVEVRPLQSRANDRARPAEVTQSKQSRNSSKEETHSTDHWPSIRSSKATMHAKYQGHLTSTRVPTAVSPDPTATAGEWM